MKNRSIQLRESIGNESQTCSVSKHVHLDSSKEFFVLGSNRPS